MRIILCRNVTTKKTPDGTLAGQDLSLLDGSGWDQATRLALRIARLNDLPVGAILTSDQPSSRKPGEYVQVRLDVPLISSPALREVDLGTMAGLTEDQAIRKYQNPKHWTSNPSFNYRDIGGESAELVRQRYFIFLNKEIEARRVQGDRCVVLIGHDLALTLVFTHARKQIARLPERGGYTFIDW